MKIRTNKFSLILTAFFTFLVMVISVCLFAACGRTDYSKFDWYAFAEKTEGYGDENVDYGYWDKKQISYQMFYGDSGDIDANGAYQRTFGMANFYSDGTFFEIVVACYGYDPEKETCWFFDGENQIRAALFGTWSTWQDSTLDKDILDEINETDDAADTDLVVHLTKRYVVAAETWYNLLIRNNEGKLSGSLYSIGFHDGSDAETKKAAAEGSDTVKYAKIRDFIDSYIGLFAGEEEE